MGFSRQEYWNGLPCPPPGDLPDLGIQPTSLMSPALAGVFFTTAATAAAKSLQSCPTLRDAIDGSPPGSPVPGILQARTLEWVAISFSNACMHAKSLQSCLTLQCHRWQPTRLLCPQDSLGRNTGVGCHFLLWFFTTTATKFSYLKDM